MRLRDRGEALWLLSLAGLRRSEVLGLKWSDVDLDGKVLHIRRGRVQTGGSEEIAVGEPKTRKGKRSLPLPPYLCEALKRLRSRQAETFGLAQVRDEWIGVDAAGREICPEVYSDEWKSLCSSAEVGDFTLHEARHSSVTAMREAEVLDMLVAKWHGHDEAVMMRTCSHPSEEVLRTAGEAPSRVIDGTA